MEQGLERFIKSVQRKKQNFRGTNPSLLNLKIHKKLTKNMLQLSHLRLITAQIGGK